MKLLIRLGLVAMMALTMTVISCSKYEEGPKFTLLTKTSRAVNVWKVQSWTANANDVTGMNTISEFNVKKDNSIVVTYTVFGVSTINTGTWAFNSDKSKFVWTKQNGDVVSYDIIKLAQDEMKLQVVDSGVTYITVFVTK